MTSHSNAVTIQKNIDRTDRMAIAGRYLVVGFCCLAVWLPVTHGFSNPAFHKPTRVRSSSLQRSSTIALAHKDEVGGVPERLSVFLNGMSGGLRPWVLSIGIVAAMYFQPMEGVNLPIDNSPLIVQSAFAEDTPAVVEDTKSTKPILDSDLAAKGRETKYSPVDEVWDLVDKYFIDRTFNDQDWAQVRLTYKAKEIQRSDSMQLVDEMVKSLGDKYTRLLDKGQYAAIQKFDLIGVGATFMPDSDKKLIVGAPPVPGSAADQAGLKIGDFLEAVNGVSTKGRNAFDIIDQISEKPNAKTVTLTLRRQSKDDIPGEGQSRTIELSREFAEVKNPVTYKVTERRSDGTKVGYIRIKEFNSLVKANLIEALDDLQNKEKVNALVLDLRGNPGGAFQSAVEISGLFFEDRVATYVVDNNQGELPFRAAKGKRLVDESEPIALWLDGFSASASEVLAGSLHDNCRAVVMGDKSFGKGLIQAVYGLKNGAGLVLTVAKYVTPNGYEIQSLGINPDIKGGVPPRIPGLDTDTSKVDFNEIATRLGPDMCKVPYQHPDMQSGTQP